MEVIIIGAGGFAKQVIDVFELNKITIKGIVDDFSTNGIYNYPILGNMSLLDDNDSKIFCAIGDVNVRKKIFDSFPHDRFINCIHPNSIISPHSIMGTGNYLGPNVCIMPDVVIGNNNIIDPCVVLSHDCVINDNNHLAAGSCLLGKVTIKDCNLIGSNSTILPKLTLNSNNILGAGAVLTKSFESNKILVGVPARDNLLSSRS